MKRIIYLLLISLIYFGCEKSVVDPITQEQIDTVCLLVKDSANGYLATYIYDDSNRVSRIETSNVTLENYYQGNGINYQTTADYADSKKDSYTDKTYEDNLLVKSRTHLNMDAFFIGELTYTYDDKNRVSLTEGFKYDYLADGVTPHSKVFIKTTYEYDTANNVVEKKDFIKSNPSDEYVISYSEITAYDYSKKYAYSESIKKYTHSNEVVGTHLPISYEAVLYQDGNEYLTVSSEVEYEFNGDGFITKRTTTSNQSDNSTSVSSVYYTYSCN